MYQYTEEAVRPIFEKWLTRLRLTESWNVKLELVDDPDFAKTGDIKIDPTDRKAILLLNARNPRQENPEEVICHELMHLKLYPLDQLTETLIDCHYPEGSPQRSAMYTQFMVMLETTVEELTKCWLGAMGENAELSYGRCRGMKSFKATPHKDRPTCLACRLGRFGTVLTGDPHPLHAICLHFFRHSAQLSLAESQDHKWSDWRRSCTL